MPEIDPSQNQHLPAILNALLEHATRLPFVQLTDQSSDLNGKSGLILELDPGRSSTLQGSRSVGFTTEADAVKTLNYLSGLRFKVTYPKA